VALNCIANRFVFEEGPFTRLFVQPAAHDAGTAVGAAYYIWNHVLRQPRREILQHAYLGPEFSDAEIEVCLRTRGLRYRRSENLEQEVAQLISQRQIVGFFQGRMELGPRALGNRSLLADPRVPQMREILNRKVKHREYFRPFAPSILQEEVARWFTIKKETAANDFMLMTYPVKDEMKDRIPAVIHVDGTSRIQTVRRDTNPRYHKLISEFFALTGVPILLNTSFNDSEPIVCTPDDALNTFAKTEIDYLVLGDFVVSRSENDDSDHLC
jgi:carbamoyltransferase